MFSPSGSHLRRISLVARHVIECRLKAISDFEPSLDSVAPLVMPPKRPAQTRTYLPIRRSYLGLDHHRFHFAEAQFSRRVEPISSAQPFGPDGRPKMPDQRLQLTYFFVKDKPSGIPPWDRLITVGYPTSPSFFGHAPKDTPTSTHPSAGAPLLRRTRPVGSFKQALYLLRQRRCGHNMTRLFACPLRRGWARPTVLPNSSVEPSR